MDSSKGRLGSLKLLTSALTVALGISLGSTPSVEAASASQKPKASVAQKAVKPTKKLTVKPVSKPKASQRKVTSASKLKMKSTVTKSKAAAVTKAESQPLPGMSPTPEVAPKQAVPMPEPQGVSNLEPKASATNSTLKTGAALLGVAVLGAAAQHVMADSAKPEANTTDNDAAVSEKARIEAELKSQSWGEVKAAPPGAKPTWEAPDLTAAWAEEEASAKADDASLAPTPKADEDVNKEGHQSAQESANVPQSESASSASLDSVKPTEDDSAKKVATELTSEAAKPEPNVTPEASSPTSRSTGSDALTQSDAKAGEPVAQAASHAEGAKASSISVEKTESTKDTLVQSSSKLTNNAVQVIGVDKTVNAQSDAEKTLQAQVISTSSSPSNTLKAEAKPVNTPAPVGTFTVYEEAYPPKVHPFLGVTPYVTTKADIKARFEDKARSLSEGSLGDRDAISNANVSLGEEQANQWLVSYTRQGTVSDMFISMPSDKREAVIAILKAQFEKESPDGFWKERPDGTWVWRDETSQCVIYPSTGDDFSIEYGAVARVARETSDWMTKDVSVQLRFAHVDLLKATLADLKTKESATCHAPELLERNDGNDEAVYVMKGQCFGLPGETQSLIWLDENHQHLSRLSIEFSSRLKDVKALETSLKKRFIFNADLGQYKMDPVPYRNIWVPSISLDKTHASLTFYFYGDGVRRAHDEWVKHLEEKAEQRRLNEKVDALFN